MKSYQEWERRKEAIRKKLIKVKRKTCDHHDCQGMGENMCQNCRILCRRNCEWSCTCN